jgi:hypothetical protein
VICIPESLMVDYGSKMVVWAAFRERVPAQPERLLAKDEEYKVSEDWSVTICLYDERKNPAKRKAFI